MKLQLTILFLGCLALSACSLTTVNTSNITPVPCPASDILMHNAVVYSPQDNSEEIVSAQAVAITQEKIVFVGTNDEAKAWRCGAKSVKDMQGAFIYPGFTDGHQHLEGVGRRTRTLSLFGIDSLAATVARIKQWANNIPDEQWVLGRGWIEREWTDEQRYLRAADVDPFTANKPLFMPRADGVSALVNSKAMALAGVDKNTPDPEGGKFERDAQGHPTGYILATAMQLFRDIIPAETDDYIKGNLALGMQVNAKMGWTQTHDAGMTPRELRLLRELHQDNAMQHRVYVAVPIADAAEIIASGPEQTDDGWLFVNGIKVFIDGTLGSRGAALLEAYSDAPHKGFMNRTTKAELMPVLDAALAQGLQVMTHVIGDRALVSALDWYAQSWAAKPQSQWATTDLRWRLEHAQIIPPAQQQRLVDMGVVPSMQPSHGIGDLNFAPARLGPDRLKYAYPWQSLVELGLPIVAGSDAPVEVGDPRIEFYAAITRQRLDGTSGEGWHPELAVSRTDALRMLTQWPAYGAFQEGVRGTIEVGKYADFSVFDTDFMTAEPQAILQAKAVMTMVGGRITYAHE